MCMYPQNRHRIISIYRMLETYFEYSDLCEFYAGIDKKMKHIVMRILVAWWDVYDWWQEVTWRYRCTQIEDVWVVEDRRGLIQTEGRWLAFSFSAKSCGKRLGGRLDLAAIKRESMQRINRDEKICSTWSNAFCKQFIDKRSSDNLAMKIGYSVYMTS